MMLWYGNGWSFWQLALMWSGMVALCGLLIWAVYAFVAGALPRPGGARGIPRDNPRHVLDERLARGDIDSDEYRRLLDVIASRDETSAVGAGSRR